MSTEAQFSYTFTATATLSQWQRVFISSGEVVVAVAATANSIGCVARDVLVAGDEVTVYLDGPVRKGIADSAITAGDLVYGDAAGEIDDDGTNVIGVALQDAAADEWFDYMARQSNVA